MEKEIKTEEELLAEEQEQLKPELFFEDAIQYKTPPIRQLVLDNFNVDEYSIVREGVQEIVYSPYGDERILIKYVNKNTYQVTDQLLDTKNMSQMAGNKIHVLKNRRIITDDLIGTLTQIAAENKAWRLDPK
ncbi:MAG: hypothetical protein ACRC4M_03735 [Mycoplasma sp.]